MRQRFEHGGQERLDHQYLRTDVEVERKLEIALRQDGAVVQASGDIEPHIHSAELCRRYLHGRTAGQVEHMGWCPPWHSFSSARLTSVAIMRDRHGGSRRCHSPMPWATAVTLSLPLRLPMSRYFRLEGEPSCAREAERPWSSNVEPVVGSEKAGRASLHPCHVGLLCVAVASLSAHGLARTDNAGSRPCSSSNADDARISSQSGWTKRGPPRLAYAAPSLFSFRVAGRSSLTAVSALGAKMSQP